MATPSPPSPQLVPFKSTPRKLPIKRKTPDSNSNPNNPNPNPNPNPILALPLNIETAAAASSSAAAAFLDAIVPYAAAAAADDDDDDDDDDCDEDDAAEGGGADPSPSSFKFHRVWSESDEIRFLQGLLACHSQGMTFPRDLNLYYDRFSEAMSTPFTRSQLSEKLRRLRKKFRVHSARIARGLDRSALSSHDRDLFHLSTLLWDPSHSTSSPFSSPNGGNKRRRPFLSPIPPPPPPVLAILPPPASSSSPPPSAHPDDIHKEEGGAGSSEEQMKGFVSSCGNAVMAKLVAKTALDVFDSCLKEVRILLASKGPLYPDQNTKPGSAGDLEKRWREQHILELDVLARRLRLVLGQVVEE